MGLWIRDSHDKLNTDAFPLKGCSQVRVFHPHDHDDALSVLDIVGMARRNSHSCGSCSSGLYHG